jgi:hypothetical protein
VIYFIGSELSGDLIFCEAGEIYFFSCRNLSEHTNLSTKNRVGKMASSFAAIENYFLKKKAANVLAIEQRLVLIYLSVYL